MGVDLIRPRESAPVKPTPPAPSKVRTIALSCGNRPLPAGRLLAIRPTLAQGASAGFTVILPNGDQEIVAWIRNYEAEFADTYWLQSPMVLPRGSRLRVEAEAGPGCRVELTIGLQGQLPTSNFQPPRRNPRTMG